MVVSLSPSNRGFIVVALAPMEDRSGPVADLSSIFKFSNDNEANENAFRFRCGFIILLYFRCILVLHIVVVLQQNPMWDSLDCMDSYAIARSIDKLNPSKNSVHALMRFTEAFN